MVLQPRGMKVVGGILGPREAKGLPQGHPAKYLQSWDFSSRLRSLRTVPRTLDMISGQPLSHQMVGSRRAGARPGLDRSIPSP